MRREGQRRKEAWDGAGRGVGSGKSPDQGDRRPDSLTGYAIAQLWDLDQMTSDLSFLVCRNDICRRKKM